MQIRYNNNMNQQQINDSFNMKFQHLIYGQQKYWIFNIVCHQCNSHSESYTFTINPDSSSDIQPHPKRQRQMLLTPSVSNRSRVPSQVATSYEAACADTTSNSKLLR